MKAVKITGRNIMFTKPTMYGWDLNLGLLLGDNRNYVIDTGVGRSSVWPVLDYLGNDKKPIVVINTHYHWDHVWGNWCFPGATVISHSLCRVLIDKHWDEDLEQNKQHVIDGDVHKKLPDLVFLDKLYFPDDGVSIFHTPGHTKDCISVYDERDRVLYAGDNIGDTDEEILPVIDTDPGTFNRLISLYDTYDFDVCISGHNKPQGKDVVGRMDVALYEYVKKQNEGGS